MKIGRNDPCPCGSGKKYKHCCLSPLSSVKSEFQEFIENQPAGSIEDLQALTDGFMLRRNQQPLDDFHGLSPGQMHRLLHYPFDSPDLVRFSETVTGIPSAQLLTLAEQIAGAAGEQGLKATARGNLPQKLCREAARVFYRNLPADDIHHAIRVNKEQDFLELNVARIVLELGGLLRKSKGRFLLTRKFQRLASSQQSSALYPALLRTYCMDFNWAYQDGYDEAGFIQQSFAFTLYLLARYGEDWRSSSFYTDCYFQAFPMAVDEFEASAWSSSEDTARRCFGHRVLKLFFRFTGLAEIEKAPGDQLFFEDFRIRKLPLLDEAVRFVI
jgi:hypothetical protein